MTIINKHRSLRILHSRWNKLYKTLTFQFLHLESNLRVLGNYSVTLNRSFPITKNVNRKQGCKGSFERGQGLPNQKGLQVCAEMLQKGSQRWQEQLHGPGLLWPMSLRDATTWSGSSGICCMINLLIPFKQRKLWQWYACMLEIMLGLSKSRFNKLSAHLVLVANEQLKYTWGKDLG